MKYGIDDIAVVFTCCWWPEFVRRAMKSIFTFYPDLEAVIVDDACRQHDADLEALSYEFGTVVLRNEKRMGAGRSIDRGVRWLKRPLVLTVDHGVEMHTPGLLELYLQRMNDPDVLCAGMKRNDKRCNRAFGPYVDPVFALFDREFIVAHDLTFALTNIRIKGEDWGVGGCSTGQFLEYRGIALGKKLSYISPKTLHMYVRHHRTPRDRGAPCSPQHEPMEVDADDLPPRLKNRDGSYVWPGHQPRKRAR